MAGEFNGALVAAAEPNLAAVGRSAGDESRPSLIPFDAPESWAMSPPTALPRCYLASPFGFTDAGRRYYRDVYVPTLATVVSPVDPWALTSPEEISQAREHGHLREMMLEIGCRNSAAIRSSPLLAALLDGQEPDSGTVAELGYAAGLGKACFGLRTDLRQTGEEGVAVSLQVEAFVIESGGAIARTLAELVAMLRDSATRVREPRTMRR
jgi:nucleoside 2-deoxyribosyltransferase